MAKQRIRRAVIVGQNTYEKGVQKGLITKPLLWPSSVACAKCSHDAISTALQALSTPILPPATGITNSGAFGGSCRRFSIRLSFSLIFTHDWQDEPLLLSRRRWLQIKALGFGRDRKLSNTLRLREQKGCRNRRRKKIRRWGMGLSIFSIWPIHLPGR